VRVRDQSIRFAGVPDIWSGDVDGDSAFRNIAADDPAILLAHNPDTKDILADLVLGSDVERPHPWREGGVADAG
jgi:predicted MPP superfamily phosphohydrolase